MNTVVNRLNFRAIILLYAIVCLSIICGCESGGRAVINTTGSKDAVKDTFYKWRDAILNSDWKPAYELTSSILRDKYPSYEAWESDYKNSGIKRYLDNIDGIKDISLDDDGATIRLTTKDKNIVTFWAVVEYGHWRIGSKSPYYGR